MTMVAPVTTDEAFTYCERLVREHYENFPVASLFLPRGRRRYVAAIYAFARTADDLADEGSLPAEERLAKLKEWEDHLDAAYAGRATHPVFIAMAETAARTGIPRDLPAGLLTAFRMDVTHHRYRTYGEVLEYCRFSANPVGRIVLHLFGAASDETVGPSDAICTALQLTNFLQDLARDSEHGRLYLPLEDCERFGYTEEDLKRRTVDGRFRALMQNQIDRIRDLFRKGLPLLPLVKNPLRLELDLTIRGGNEILSKIEKSGYDVLTRRPVLTAADNIRLITRTLFHRNHDLDGQRHNPRE
jgi:squalene synthase HpnC